MSWVITGQEAGPLGLLDQYGGAAAAYSLRNLSLYHADPVVRVRRSSDNTESDFTATQVSDGTLAAWVGAGNNGFVRTWYDQSGNGRHGVQATTAAQPRIVNSGSLETFNSKPAISFDATANTNTGQNLLTTHVLSGSFTILSAAIITTANAISQITSNAVFSSMGAGQWSFTKSSSNVLLRTNGTTDSSASFTNNASTIFSAFGNGSGTISIGVNQASLVSNTGHTTSFTNATWIGGVNSGTTLRSLGGSIAEIIFYSTDLSANRTALQNNINAHYSIY